MWSEERARVVEWKEFGEKFIVYAEFFSYGGML